MKRNNMEPHMITASLIKHPCGVLDVHCHKLVRILSLGFLSDFILFCMSNTLDLPGITAKKKKKVCVLISKMV